MKKPTKNALAALFAAGALAKAALDTYGLRAPVYHLAPPGLPEGLNGFRIIQLSDLHQARFGKGQSRLLKAIRDAEPDLILITGDLIDSADTAKAAELVEGLRGGAPAYYVTGNHEAGLAGYPRFREYLRESGVIVLEDQAAALEHNGAAFTLIGLKDQEFFGIRRDPEAADAHYREALSRLAAPGRFNILLAHHPEAIRAYADFPIALAFCGHAHGGQIRLPLGPALYAPDQGFLPHYCEGVYSRAGTLMVVSRGLGCSDLPFRFRSPAELAVTVLEKPKEDD